VGHFKRKFQVEGYITHQPQLEEENQSDYPFMWYQNIGSMFFLFVTKHACDGQNYDPQDRASTAASRGKKQYDRERNGRLMSVRMIYLL